MSEWVDNGTTKYLGVLVVAVCVCIWPAPPVRAQSDATLEYLGRYDIDAAPPTDAATGTAVYSDDFLVVASRSGLAMVSRGAMEAGTVLEHRGSYEIGLFEPSNLDGAPTNFYYRPKFFNVAVRPPYAYVTTRFDGLWILRIIPGLPDWRITEVGRHLRPREFTESVQILDNWLLLTHHADGIELMDLSGDPTHPVSVATLREPFVDAWGIHAESTERIWVADGAGGVKLLRLVGDELELVAGETVEISPGTVFDVVAVGDWVVAAAGGQGLAVYDRSTAARSGTFPIPGVCVDVALMAGDRVAVACRGWIHVVDVDPDGQLQVIASTLLHRRTRPGNLSTHIGSQVAVAGDRLYVAGWDHVDTYRLVADSPVDLPDLQLSSQRVQFGHMAGSIDITLTNGGHGTLVIEAIDCTASSITCQLEGTVVQPGDVVDLTVSYDGSRSNVYTRVDLFSNDPAEPRVSIDVFAALLGVVDPSDMALPFAGLAITRDYDTDTFEESTIRLSDFVLKEEVVHFAIFGTWCPACVPAIASMVGDVARLLPDGVSIFLVNQAEPRSVLEHVLEKVYVPIRVLLDPDGQIGGMLYRQPGVGLPFSRAYIMDTQGTVPYVFTTYDPSAVLDGVHDALP